MSFKEMFITIADKEEYVAIQEHLFSQGYEWVSTGRKLWDDPCNDKGYVDCIGTNDTGKMYNHDSYLDVVERTITHKASELLLDTKAGLEYQIKQIQKKLDAVVKAEKDAKFAPMLSSKCGYYLDNDGFIAKPAGVTFDISKDQNQFEDYTQAVAYADAFRVILELRRCKGAGVYDGCGSWLHNGNLIADYDKNLVDGFLFPPFPTKELAHAALDSVGEERFMQAIKFLSNSGK